MNRRGGMIVEAAIVFPVIILTVIALLYMLIYFYNQTSEQVDMHRMLRSECGAICENMYYKRKDESQIPVYRKNGKIYCYSSVNMDSKGIMEHSTKSLTAEKYLIDETFVVRRADMTDLHGEDSFGGETEKKIEGLGYE